jgi:phosphonopyruvate decarboxylase
VIDAVEVVRCLSEYSFDPYLAVPCTLLKPLLSALQSRNSGAFFAAPNEGEAIGIAVGAHLAGRNPVVVCQHSGIGNMMNPLTSLIYTFRIPLLLIVSWRGEPGLPDQPQHELMGQITRQSLSLIGVENALFPPTSDQIRRSLATAVRYMKTTSLPFAFILSRQIETFADESIEPCLVSPTLGELTHFRPEPPVMTRLQAIETVMSYAGDNDLVLSTTGFTSRELFNRFDRAGNFYVIGSMGCASTIGLGIACYYTAGKVIVLDGDGAALMRLQALATIGHYRPCGLLHIVLDNGCYDSTGGQATISRTVRFAQVAQACGYTYSATLSHCEDLRRVMDRCLHTSGPHFIHVQLVAGADSEVGRPSLTPIQIRERFADFVRVRTHEPTERRSN